MEAVLKALAEPRRVAILKIIGRGEMRAGQIAEYFDTTRPAVSQHLRVLMDANLISERRVGTRRLYRVRTETFAELRGYIEGFWDDRLTKLKRAVEGDARSKRRRR